MTDFKLVSDFQPTGDQPAAIEGLVSGLQRGLKHQTLLGATGTGKTFTIAQVVQAVNRPTLVMCHNKTLAAQLYSEFKEFFPHNAVEYFVSYYDYYQPEAYVPQKDLYVEKETDINEDIDRLRLSATTAVMSRRDVLVVASVSCIYGLGNPEAYHKGVLNLKAGQAIRRDQILRHLVGIHYKRNEFELRPGTFRAKGDTLEIVPAYDELAYRIAMWGDEVERLQAFNPITGEILQDFATLDIYPAKHFITEEDKLQAAIHDIEQELKERLSELMKENRLLEAQRLEQRVQYDLEMLRELGYCSGIENYSRHLDQRPPGSPPWTLIDYMPPDYLLVIDESHMTIPQIRGMYGGDRSRKQTLVDYGFRLPSALDNRPLNFEEFEGRVNQVIYTTATPGPYEMEKSEQVVQQIIRPTGILDPEIEVRPVLGQVDDLLGEIQARVHRGQRTLVTTLTKRMAEDLADYLTEMGVKVHYLHSEIDTLERIDILRDLRMGVYDVVVGINLLREGLDLPEVSLVAILDADKQGFLRSESALIQTIGRAARHVEGKVIMYADKITEAMESAIRETNRRRAVQQAYNAERGIEPQQIVKEIRDLTESVRQSAREEAEKASVVDQIADLPKLEMERAIRDLERQMKQAAKELEFEKAAMLRDQIIELKGIMALRRTEDAGLPLIDYN
ncbi:MAG: excinuclease ABC subunit UvrB [Anaerolineae bacterium]